MKRIIFITITSLMLSLNRKFFQRFQQIAVSQIKRTEFNQIIKYNYIRKKELDQIKGFHGDSLLQQFKVYSKQAKYIYKQGWSAFKHDFKTFYELRKRLKDTINPLTAQEKRNHKRMRQQIQRMKTLIIIQILPFSGVLLLFYIYAYPTSIPSWFTVDTFYLNHQLQCIEKQKEAINYFKKYPLNTEKLHLSHLGLQDIKRLSNLFFGHYEDGVVGYNKVLPQKSKQYLFAPQFSKYLLLKNLKKEFKQDQHNYPELQGFSLQELVLWKYDKVMKGQHVLVYQPLDQINPINKQGSISNQQPKAK